MKDANRAELEAHRPAIPAAQAIQFCLDQLYRDRTKTLEEYVAGSCTYEELIGALLLARDLSLEEGIEEV